MSDLNGFRERASRFQGSLLWSEPLSKHTYYRIGGPADLVLVPEGIRDLELLREGLAATGAPFFLLGSGSNTLASDDGYRGIVIKTSKLNTSIDITPDLIKTGASVTVTTLLRHASKNGWSGFEIFSGIPGSVGGLVAMNAGTHLGEAKDLAVSIQVFHLKDPAFDREILVKEGDFSYRKNHFLGPYDLVTSVSWKLHSAPAESVSEKISSVLARRKESQPLEYPSCGSVFKNPIDSGKRAWEVIDSLGLRGKQIGHAQFSEKHPNFIVNRGGAKAADVRALIELAKSEALSRLGIQLQEEVQYLGS